MNTDRKVYPILNSIDKLDTVLNKMIQLKDMGRIYLSVTDIFNALQDDCYEEIENETEDGIKYTDVLQRDFMIVDFEIDITNILNQLYLEKWVSKDVDKYYLDFKADKKGCYIKDFQKKLLEENIEKEINVEKRGNDKWISIGTVIAGIATSCLVLIELIKEFKWIFSIELLTAIFLFTSGICAGLIIHLIKLEVKHQRKTK